MEKALEMDFLMNYPAVVFRDEKYTGYIFVNNRAYPVSIKSNDAGNKFTLETNPKLEKFASQIQSDYSHPVQVLNALKDIISADLEHHSVSLPTDLWRKILQEYGEFNNYHHRLESCILSPDLTEVRVVHVDSARRKHEVVIRANYKVGSKLFETIGYDLPESCTFEANDSLLLLYDKFIGAIEGLQEFFELMDEIDGNCWVLEPERPTKKDCYRRIALSDTLSMVVTFSPSKIKQIPEMKFLGPLSSVTLLSENHNTNIGNWDSGGNVLSEIVKLLDLIEFPCKPSKDSHEDLMLVNPGECCICFSLRLNNKLPDIVCPNTCCSQFFHEECLYQWLTSLQPKVFYKTIYGQCPNCEKAIECPVPES